MSRARARRAEDDDSLPTATWSWDTAGTTTRGDVAGRRKGSLACRKPRGFERAFGVASATACGSEGFGSAESGSQKTKEGQGRLTEGLSFSLESHQDKHVREHDSADLTHTTPPARDFRAAPDHYLEPAIAEMGRRRHGADGLTFEISIQ